MASWSLIDRENFVQRWSCVRVINTFHLLMPFRGLVLVVNAVAAFPSALMLGVQPCWRPDTGGRQSFVRLGYGSEGARE